MRLRRDHKKRCDRRDRGGSKPFLIQNILNFTQMVNDIIRLRRSQPRFRNIAIRNPDRTNAKRPRYFRLFRAIAHNHNILRPISSLHHKLAQALFLIRHLYNRCAFTPKGRNMTKIALNLQAFKMLLNLLCAVVGEDNTAHILILNPLQQITRALSCARMRRQTLIRRLKNNICLVLFRQNLIHAQPIFLIKMQDRKGEGFSVFLKRYRLRPIELKTHIPRFN